MSNSMKLIMENWRRNMNEGPFRRGQPDDEGGSNIQRVEDGKTIGDLKALIQTAQLKKRGEQLKSGVVDAAKNAVVDELIGKVPFLATAKSLFDFAKDAYQLPDESRTGTALDFLDVDDDISKIVDDPIENSFLTALGKTLNSLPDDRTLEDINVTKELQAYIAKNFNKKSVATDVDAQSSIS